MHRLQCLCFGIVVLCAAAKATSEDKSQSPTFSANVARLIYDRCSNCHRPGQSGPFSLLTYDQVVSHAKTIEEVISTGYMPPWKPVDHGIAFEHNRSLTPNERSTILQWIEAKFPVGDKSKIPNAPEFYDGWSLGKPDLIVKLSEPFPIPADGPDLYRSFAFAVGIPEDRWIKAIEVRPTARGVVHHALFFVDVEGHAKKQRSRDGLPGFVGMNFLRGQGNTLDRVPESMSRGLGGYVPGAVPNKLPGDLARFLPKGADIVMQTHFHPTGKRELEQTELGIYFATDPPAKRLVSLQLPALFGMGAGIDIPAGKADFHIRDSYRLPVAIRGVEIGGHAHYLCTRMTMQAKLPNDETIILLEIDDWDLDWQDQYVFKHPIDLPADTELIVDLWYDNTTNNPENPFSPPQRVSWGRESTDEMGSITLLAVANIESERELLERDLQQRTRSGLASRIRSQLGVLGGFGGNTVLGDRVIKLLDRNRNGSLERSELPPRMQERLLDLFDESGDETITPDEMDLGRKNVQRFLEEDDVIQKGLREKFRAPANPKPMTFSAVESGKLVAKSLSTSKPSVLVFVQTECPIANSYQPKLRRLRQEFGGSEFEWITVYSQRGIEVGKIASHAKDFEVEGLWAADADHSLAKRLGISVSPQAIVIAPTGDVVYRGRIDDLYDELGSKKRSAIQHDDLRNALNDIRQGRGVAVRETQAVGCKINFD